MNIFFPDTAGRAPDEQIYFSMERATNTTSYKIIYLPIPSHGTIFGNQLVWQCLLFSIGIRSLPKPATINPLITFFFARCSCNAFLETTTTSKLRTKELLQAQLFYRLNTTRDPSVYKVNQSRQLS